MKCKHCGHNLLVVCRYDRVESYDTNDDGVVFWNNPVDTENLEITNSLFYCRSCQENHQPAFFDMDFVGYNPNDEEIYKQGENTND